MENTNTQPIRATGALISIPDNRRIALASFMPKVARPKMYRCDDNDIPTEDQGIIGTCVGEAEGGEIEYREKKDTGIVTPVAKLQLYRDCKAVDGYDGEGTFPSVAANIKVKKGVVSRALVADVRGLSHADTIKPIVVTPEIESDASLRVAAGYAYVTELEDILQALFQKGTFTATLMVGDWSQCPVKPGKNAHRVRLNGYEELDNGDVKIWFRNSWGLNWATYVDEHGNGFFLWSDYKLDIHEMIVYTDVPTALLLKAKNTNYMFTRTLKFGMKGDDVKELQKRLNKEIASDGQPCYSYKANGAVFFSNYFGSETEKAVKRYQATKNIVSSGTPETTGYGQLGPSTRSALNNKEAEVYLDLYPRVADLRDKLKRIMAATGHPITITDEYRSIKEQDELYAQGRTKPGNIVTNAKGGESFHNFRCAFDIAFTNGKGITYTGPWNMVGEIGKAIGLEWGGDWTSIVDKPHFQLTLGYSLSDFRNGTIDVSKFNKII